MSKALTKKEQEIIEELIAHGLSNKKIADIVGRSSSVVSSIRNGTRDESLKKSRENWRQKHGYYDNRATIMKNPENNSYYQQIHLPENPGADWNQCEELNKLSFSLNCLTAAVTKLCDLIEH